MITCFSTRSVLIRFRSPFSDGFPFPWAILPVVGTLLLISALAADRRATILHRLFENNVSVYLGRISYSLYLWHWPVYVLLRWTFGLESALHMLLALILTLLLGIASFHLVEQPLRNGGLSLLRKRSSTIIASVLITIIAFYASVWAADSQEQLSLSVTRDKQLWYPENWSQPDNQALHKSETMNGRRLFVLGDSHVGAYGTLLGELSSQHGVEVISLFTGGCGVVNLIRPAATESCKTAIAGKIDQLKRQAKAGDVVFLASLRMHRFSDQWTEFPLADVDDRHEGPKAIPNRQLAFKEAESLLKLFQKMGLHVIIDAPKPVFKVPPFRCADWFNRSNPVCASGLTMDRQVLLKYMEPIQNSLSKLDKAFDNLHVWEPFPILCPEEPCSAFHNGQPLYFDGDHLSGYGNRLLYPSFEQLLIKIWAD